MPTLVEALQGLMGPHQRMLLDSLLRHLDFLDKEISRLDEEVAQRMRPFDEAIDRLDGIHGMGRRSVEEILTEIGTDMSRFPSADNLASWAKLCPGNNESAGKHKSGSTGHGNPWLRAILVQVAWSAARTKRTYLSSLYHRLAGRRGSKRAILAVAHAILVIVYSMLRNRTPYRDVGEDYFDHLNHQSILNRAIRRIERLGYNIILEPLMAQKVVSQPVFS